MPDFSPEQLKVIARADKALKDAHKLGLCMRVFDGAVLMLKVDAFRDPRYGSFGSDMDEWTEEHTMKIGGRLDADGGAGK
ncbi:hypothetical protein ACYPKM_00830 [Pseudomonas aeruginosa]